MQKPGSDEFGRAEANGLPAAIEDEFLARLLDEDGGDPRAILRDFQAKYPVYASSFERVALDLLYAGESCRVLTSASDAQLPEAIGSYRVLRELGRGGFGVVFLVQQDEPIRRQVALKLLQRSAQTSTIVQRFEQERDTLAQMDHPGIAKIFDAGTSEHGPYFAMEYVPGQPITDYCDAQGLSIEARLRVFLDVCAAVQHAHQKGVVHRDLTPRNVLVREGHVVKVIDFGLAKLLEAELSARPGITDAGRCVGTLEYMSPEQALSEPVDTRTDIYALGVVLYELLTGLLPFESSRLRGGGLRAAMRILSEEPAMRPSSALSSRSLGRSAAEARGLPTADLVRALRGDLDLIVLKAIEKDPDERFETVADLAGDVRRYLEDQPIRVRAPSALYLVRKFARRHRAYVLAAAAVAAVLLAATVGAIYAVVEIVRANEVAVAEAREADRRAYEAAIATCEAARAVGDTGLLKRALARIPDGKEDCWEYRYFRGLQEDSHRVLKLGSDFISSFILLPDARIVASKAYRGRSALEVWSADGSRRESAIELPGDSTQVALSFDGRFFAAGSVGGAVTVCDVPSHARRYQLDLGGERATCAFAERHLVVVADERVSFRAPETGREVFAYPCGPRLDVALAVSRDARFIAQTGGGGVVVSKIDWSTSPPAVERILETEVPARDLVFCEATRRFAITSHEHALVLLFDCQSAQVREFVRARHPAPTTMRFSPDGRLAAVGFRNGKVVLYDVDSGRSLRELRGHETFVDELIFTPDGAQLLSADWSSSVRRWQVRAEQRHVFETQSSVTCFEASSVVADVFVGTEAGEVECWKLDTREKLWSASTGAAVVRMLQSTADGARLLVATDAGEVLLLDAGTGRECAPRRSEYGTRLAFFRLHPAPLVAATKTHLHVLNDESLECTHRIEAPRGMRFDRHFASCAGHIAILDGPSYAVYSIARRSWQKFELTRGINSIAFTPRGSVVVSTTESTSELVEYDLQGLELRRIESVGGHYLERAHSASWSADRSRVALVVADFSIRILDAERMHELARLRTVAASSLPPRFGYRDEWLISAVQGRLLVYPARYRPR